MAIKIKSVEQIKIMKEGGEITAGALQKVLAAAEPGVSLAELDKIAEDHILRAKGEPAFKRVPGYDFTTCLNLNEGVVHGLPTEKVLREGDILSVDLGTYFKGFNTDHAWSVCIGDPSTSLGAGKRKVGDKIKFLEAGERALKASIAACRIGNRVEDISRAMETVLRERGYLPVETLVGHGVGKELHEDPQIPCLVVKTGGDSPELVEGMTLAIEVIYTIGDPELKVSSDGWTIVTADGGLAGLFEHSIAITKSVPIVLTGLR